MSGSKSDNTRGGLITFIVAITFCVLFFVYISFIHPGVDLKEVDEAVKFNASGSKEK